MAAENVVKLEMCIYNGEFGEAELCTFIITVDFWLNSTVVHLLRCILHYLHTRGRESDVYQKYLHVNLSLSVGINTLCSSKSLEYLPMLRFHGLYVHKFAVIYTLYLPPPFVVQLRK
jgi:hypothetical protein